MTGHPEPEVKWFRNDKQVAASLKNKMTKDGDLYTFVTTNITTKLAGVYKVAASNRAGIAEHAADVIVKGKQHIMMSYLLTSVAKRHQSVAVIFHTHIVTR